MSLVPAVLGSVLLLALGCGRSPAPTLDEPPASARAPATRPARAVATTAGWIECTEASRAPMEARLLARHGLEQEDPWIDRLQCVTIQLASAPAFFVQLVATDGDKHHRLHGVVALDGTTELVPLREARFVWTQLVGGKVSLETLDLDGDGADEVLVRYDDHRQLISDAVDVIAIRGRDLLELAGPPIAFHDPDLDERCHGTLAFEPAAPGVRLVVTTRGSTGRSEHCLDDGRHAFALIADRLVELPAARAGS